MAEIPKWYAGRSVLVTGGTGFMGKVLLEKLLRSCPDIRKVYILCRAKRGLTPKARLTEFSKLPVFERLRNENPSQLSKLHIIEGDILQPNLGIKDQDILLLQEEVSIVFNGAASLKLEAELKENVAANTKGTKQLLDMSLGMKKLVAFIHFSTAFCHPEQQVLEEKLYPSPVNPHDVMRAMDWMDDETIKALTPRTPQPTLVLNMSTNEIEPITWGEIIERGKKLIMDYPFEAGLWFPNGQIRSNRFWHYFFVIFTQILPAYLVDFVMVLIRQKTFLVRVQNRIWLGMHLLEYFTTRNWDFKNKVCLSLHNNLSEKDKAIFFMDNVDHDINKYMRDIILGARQYCLKEPMSSLPKARRQIKFLYMLDKLGKAFILCLLGWLLIKTVFATKSFFDYLALSNKIPFVSTTPVLMRT
ncbi:hypothetical protein WDU94_015363 [Cyamophila willieti]